MKLLLVLAFSLVALKANPYIAFLALGTNATSSNTLTNGLVAYWKMNETNTAPGANVNRSDSWVNTITLTDVNTNLSGIGKFNNGADFESLNSSYMTTGADTALLDFNGNQSFAISVWVKLETTANTGVIVSKWNTTGNLRQYKLDYAGGATLRFRLQVCSTDGASGNVATVIASNAGAPSAGTWYHIIAEHDADADQLTITVNGSSETPTAHTLGIYNGTANFDVGRRTGADYFDGIIDELVIMNRVFTASEKSQLYNSGTGYEIPLN